MMTFKPVGRSMVDIDFCNNLNDMSDYWERHYKTGLCLFNKTSSEDYDGLKCTNENGSPSNFRVLGCHETYDVLEKVKKNPIIS